MNKPNQPIITCKNCGNCKKKEKEQLPVKQIESDSCVDIKNHISQNTKVIEK